EVLAGWAKHDHPATRHVLAAVVADRQDHGLQSAVADAEALADHAADVRLAARRAVEGHVADDDVVHRPEGRFARRRDDDFATREALADVIVSVALQHQRDALRYERAETLAGRALEMQLNRVLRETDRAEAARHLAAEHGANYAVDVANQQRSL